MRTLESDKSRANLPALRSLIKEYDHLLDIHFSPFGGYYYISRPFDNYNDKEAAEICSGSETCFSEALKKKRLVVCYPIHVKMVEELDIAKRNIMRHLKLNDMRGLAQTAKERIRIAEQQMDDEVNPISDHLKASQRDDMRGFSREYYRDFVASKAYFGGVPRFNTGG